MNPSGQPSSDALRHLFSPESIAVVGASRTPGKMGYDIVRALVESPFSGAVYPINRDGGEVLGLAAYTSLHQTPTVPSLALVVVPSDDVVQTLRDAAAAGVRIAQVLSSGFGETGRDGQRAEAEISELAVSSGLRIVGPNCVGTYSARAGFGWTTRASYEPGGVSFVSQSGGLAYDLLLRGEDQGLRFDNVVSVGNCVDVQVADVLRYLAGLESTRAVGMYIEGVPNGRDFIDAAREAVATTPLVILKGGRSAEGSRSVGSHTGRLAGEYRLWQAAFRDVGAIEVRTMESMMAVLAAVASRPVGVRGNGVAMLGNGGGATVLAVDRCAELGLAVAAVEPGSLERLRTAVSFAGVLPDEGTPLDLPLGRLLFEGGRLFADVLDTYCSDPAVSIVVFHLNLVPLGEWTDREKVLDHWLQQLSRVDTRDAVVLPVLRTDGSAALEELRRDLAPRVASWCNGPTFGSIDDALEAASALVRIGGMS